MRVEIILQSLRPTNPQTPRREALNPTYTPQIYKPDNFAARVRKAGERIRGHRVGAARTSCLGLQKLRVQFSANYHVDFVSRTPKDRVPGLNVVVWLDVTKHFSKENLTKKSVVGM